MKQANKSIKVAKLLLTVIAISCTFKVLAANGPIPPVPSGFEAEATTCQTNGGVLLVGTVESGPWYQDSKTVLQNIELSHTHVLILPLGESGLSAEYDMAADNVFASGYDSAQPSKAVPAPLTQLVVGTVIEACGLTYTQSATARSPALQGIHWVHINNNQIEPGITDNGWVKIVNTDGSIGDNLENNPEYFYLWPTL